MRLPLVLIMVLLCGRCALAMDLDARSKQWIGKSPDGALLRLSPDGNWLLSSPLKTNWDGGERETQYRIWNLRKPGVPVQTLPFDPPFKPFTRYSWTDDNRLYKVGDDEVTRGQSSFLSYGATENPDGSERVVFRLPDGKSDEQSSGLYGLEDFAFSASGTRFSVLTKRSYFVFETRAGRLLFERRWNPLEDKVGFVSYDNPAFLSPDGTRIVAREERRVAHYQGVWKGYYEWTGFHVVLNARTGQTISRVGSSNNSWIILDDFLDDDTFSTHNTYGGSQYFFRASDGQFLSSRPFYLGNSFQLKEELVLTDPRTGKSVHYLPPRGAYRDIAISPDRKWLYTIDLDGDIFRFSSH